MAAAAAAEGSRSRGGGGGRDVFPVLEGSRVDWLICGGSREPESDGPAGGAKGCRGPVAGAEVHAGAG